MIELIQQIDRSAILFISDACDSASFARAANVFTMIGYGAAVWTAIVIWIAVRRRSWRIFLCWAIICGVIFVAGDIAIKNLVHRARPFTDMPFLVIRTVVPTSFSFPSSHAAYAGAGLVYIASVCRGRALTAVVGVLAFAVAASRLALLVHYPSDVICGFAIGMAVAAIVVRVTGMTGNDEERGASARKE